MFSESNLSNLSKSKKRRYSYLKEDIFEFYQDGKLLMVGSIKELAKKTLLHEGTLLNYSYPKYLERNKNKNVIKLFKVGSIK